MIYIYIAQFAWIYDHLRIANDYVIIFFADALARF